MKTPIALLNLWHQRARTLVSVSGVAFALLLVFAQLGFMGAVSHTATNLFDHLRFDLLLRSPNYAHFFEPGQIERRLLTIARSTPGVASVSPCWITLHNWSRIVADRDPANAPPMQPIAIMAFDPQDPVFSAADVSELVAQGLLDADNQLLIDGLTHPEFEPVDGRQFGAADVGTLSEIGGNRFQIAGVYRMGTGLAANGSVLVSDRGMARVVPWNSLQLVSLGLIRLEPGQSPQEVQWRLQQRYQLASSSPLQEPTEAVTVLTRSQALAAERHRWLWQTPIGLIFQLGVAISLVVGSAIVYMVLATDVTERLSEYATLLAVGYSRLYLARIVMTQAIVLAMVGFLCAWLLAEALYRLATSFSGITMAMEPQRVLLVLLLGLGMCCFSGLLALRKLWSAEPASLF